MEKRADANRESLRYAGAFIACLTGSGFATGQEILQYFKAYGLAGFGAIAVMFGLFAGIGSCLVLAGRREGFTRNAELFRYYGGPYAGAFFDGFTLLFVFLSYVVMVAGAGAALRQQFGIPAAVGCVVLAVLTAVTALCGFERILKTLGVIGLLIAGLAVLLGAGSFAADPAEFWENAEDVAVFQVTWVGNGWFSAVSSYVGFCILWLANFLTAIGRQGREPGTAVRGVLLGAAGFSVSCAAMAAGMLALLPEVIETEIPALVLAAHTAPALANLLSPAIFLGIYTAAVPLLWQVPSRFAAEGSAGYQCGVFLTAVCGAVISLLVPFRTLVHAVYGVSGYIGAVLCIMVVRKEAVRFWRQIS